MEQAKGWGEYVIHYDNDSYQHHIPCWVNLDEMTAEFPDGDVGEYWEPTTPSNSIDWNDSFEEVLFGTDVVTVYPAVSSWDLDGKDVMDERYGEGKFVVVSFPED